MNIVFVSNYFNHHIKPIADHFYQLFGNQFIFVETVQAMKIENLKGAQNDDFENIPYLYSIYKCNKKYISVENLYNLVAECDLAIQGDAKDIFFKQRFEKNKLTFRISEHILKGNKFDFLRIVKYFLRNIKIRNKEVYLLCASSHVSSDMKKCFSFKNKMYKWGYFPEIIKNNKNLVNGRVEKILWVGRMIEWKHPEIIITTGEIIRDLNYNCCITAIGDGPRLQYIKDEVIRRKLDSIVTFKSSLTNIEVQNEMKDSDVLIFSSDIGEGWGAVLNEGMANGCVVIANSDAGSTNYLVKNEINGFVYNNSQESFIDALKNLFTLSEVDIENIKYLAYSTIYKEWSGSVAVERLIKVVDNMKFGDSENNVYNEGPMSRA
ncbi:glycosyltransferase [Enterococcus sp. SMC-9]|uniref:glycosyltransferase n=1 Tax=Enterococcus sp. SMC-9 TaxID=2862343 RepID=UPI001E571B4B|nr:glycosyltransferase [Enterococcus sp. SMC-9]MCD1024639.1 glycosyltransferase [Enterococcus sp. SMC-9]